MRIPVCVSTVSIPLPFPTAFCFTPKAFGIEGPVMSPSNIPTAYPFCLSATAIQLVMEDFPTPPFPLIIAITFLI